MTRKHKNILIISLIVIVVIALFVYGSRPKPVKVVVEAVKRGSIEETVANTRAGTVEPCRRAKMSPAAGGQMAQLAVHEGDQVVQGQLLMALWNDDLKAQLGLARSEARSAAARAQGVCTQADIAERTRKRMQALRKSNAISEEQVEQAIATAQSSRADCTAANATADVSREQVKVVEANLERTLLKAPFDGVIVEVNGEVGEYVTPSPPGIPTLPAIDMVDRSCFYVVAPIDEVDAPRIEKGMVARISLDAFKDQRFPAHVRRISDYVLDLEKQARTVDIEVSFDSDDDVKKMLPGYSADAEVILATRDDVLHVPTEAVIDKQYVYVFHADDKSLEQRDVQLGLQNWDRSEIREGLEEGEQVVVSVDRKGVADEAYAIIDESDEE